MAGPGVPGTAFLLGSPLSKVSGHIPTSSLVKEGCCRTKELAWAGETKSVKGGVGPE